MKIFLTAVLEDGTPRRAGVPVDTRAGLEIPKGADVEIRVTLITPGGTPVGMAPTDQLLFTVKRRPEEDPKISRAAVLNGSSIGVVTLVPTDTRRLTPGLFGYDIWLTKGGVRDVVLPLSPFALSAANAPIPSVGSPPPAGGPPVAPHVVTHHKGGTDEADLELLGAPNGASGDVLTADGAGGASFVVHTSPAHAVDHNQGGSDALDVAFLGAPGASSGNILTADGAGGVSFAPIVITAHAAAHLKGGGDDVDVALLAAPATALGDVLTADGVGGVSFQTPAAAGIGGSVGADTTVVKASGGGGSTVQGSGITIDATDNLLVPGDVQASGDLRAANRLLNGQEALLKAVTGEVTGMSGTDVTIPNVVPVGTLVVGTTFLVTAEITGVGGIQAGEPTDTNRWAANFNRNLGTVSKNEWTNFNCVMWPGGSDLIFTAIAGPFTVGAIRYTIHYLDFTAPTS